jgi:microcystin-dependent protein
MSEPFIGEIRMFASSFAPAGWAFCDGSLLPISENDALFNLIGTTYGGDGQETFALPDLRGRVPIHMGQGQGISQSYQIGETGGVESVTVTTQQVPSHTHALLASTSVANSNTPQATLLAQADVDMYVAESADISFDPASIAAAGGSQPHDNMAPFLTVSFIISLFGVYPTQT